MPEATVSVKHGSSKGETGRKEIDMRKCIEGSAGKRLFIETLAVLVGVFLFSTGASAQQGKDPDAWHFGLSIYGYFPTIDGTTSFPVPAGGSDLTLETSDIIENLQGVFMGTLDVRKGRWGLLTDLMYMDVGSSETGTRDLSIGEGGLPAGATGSVDLDLKGLVWLLGGYYRAVEQPNLSVDFLLGARHLDVQQDVTWSLSGNIGSIALPGRSGSAEAELSNWDAILGARGRIALGADKTWFVPLYLDVGFGDSDFTFQGLAGLGYAFSWCDIAAGWRYLYYDLGDSGIEDMTLSGPEIAFVFRF
jgi:hypothetical protein